MKNPIIVLTGPTASGKTAMSFDLAREFNAEIICADSMTVYRGMDIGTDKPTIITNYKLKITNSDNAIVIDGIRHHLLDILDPDEEFNAAIFKQKVTTIVKEIQSRGKIPLLVGGSLLYIDSFVYDFKMPEVKPDLELRARLERETNEQLFKQLVALDPDAEWTIDGNNRRRVIRALEVCLKSGAPFTSQKQKNALPENILYLAVARDRQELYDRINGRVDEMMQEGFLEEVKKLYKQYDHSSAMQATGYRQLIQFLEGELTLAEAVEKTKQSHRNFAKKQLTWLRRNTDAVWIKEPNQARLAVNNFLI